MPSSRFVARRVLQFLAPTERAGAQPSGAAHKPAHQLIGSPATREMRPRVVLRGRPQEQNTKAQVKPRPAGERHRFAGWPPLEPELSAEELQDLGRLAAPPEAIEFLAQSLDVGSPGLWILDDATVPALRPDKASPRAVICCLRMNDISGINRFFTRVNHRLQADGLFAIRVRTIEDDKRARRRQYGNHTVFRVLYLAEFVWKRVLPKIKASRSFYFAVSGGLNRALSETEALGRLVYCGFKIVSTRRVDGLLYVIARKETHAVREVDPSYWPVFKMQRMGKGGKPIFVYKLRTMYAYADCLQGYVYEQNRLAERGKFRDDFRVTDWGRRFRRLWIDELPMLLNWIRGDLKLVGVRPISYQYASLYPQDLLDYRKQFKPGLVPPMYADLPKTFEGILSSEERYLRAYERHPVATDCRYFLRVVYNILFRSARSS